MRAILPTHSRSGFSLVELLVAMAIIGVVMTLGVRSFSILTSSWAESRALAELDDTADDVFRMIALDVADTLSATVSGVSIVGIDQVASTEGFNQADNADDRIVIPVQGLVADLSLQPVRSVQYHVHRTDERNELTRSVGPLGTEYPKNGRSDIIPRANVVRFDISYATGDTANPWVASWDSDSLPKAIRVALTLSDPYNPFRQISRKEVFPVHVQ